MRTLPLYTRSTFISKMPHTQADVGASGGATSPTFEEGNRTSKFWNDAIWDQSCTRSYESNALMVRDGPVWGLPHWFVPQEWHCPWKLTLGKAFLCHHTALRDSLAGQTLQCPFLPELYQVWGKISRKAILINSTCLVGWHPGHHSTRFALCNWDRFLFIFLWTCALISLSLTHFTVMPINESTSRVLDVKRSWWSIFKSRRHGTACPQACSFTSPVQHRRPTVRGALPTRNGGCSWPSRPSQVTYWERMIREDAFLEILLWEWASILHCMCVQAGHVSPDPLLQLQAWGCSEITGGFEAASEKHFSRSSCFSWIALATSTGTTR